MTVAITGALGHIGSKLIRSIQHNVLVDNFYTNRYCSLFNLGQYNLIQADILDADLVSIFRDIDVVIHLAAITDAENSFSNRELVERVNVDGTARVMEACLQTGSKLIFASTTSIYGVQDGEVDEDCTDLKPQSPYAKSKYDAEQLLKLVPHVILRMGTIFGVSPGMRFHTAVNKFCLQASLGQPITVWRTALNQKRPYLDLNDAVRAIQFILDRDIFDNRIYNLVTANSTVSDILSMIPKELSIDYVDTKIMNQLSYTVSNKRFCDLGFEFTGSLEAGIKETIELLTT